MKTSLVLFIAAVCVVTGCNDSGQSTSGETNSVSGNPLNAPAEYVGALGQAQRRADAVADTSSINQAIQMFQVNKGRLPTDLNELVTEKYLSQMPKPPYGMKFVYDASSGQVQVVKQ